MTTALKPNPAWRGDPTFLPDVLRAFGVKFRELPGWLHWGMGTGNTITADMLRNVRVGVDARTSLDARIYYDMDRITLHPTAGLYPLARAISGRGQFFSSATTPLRAGALGADSYDVATGSLSELAGLITGQSWETLAGAWRRDTTGKAFESTGVLRCGIVADFLTPNVLTEVDITFQASEGIIVRALDNPTYLAARLATTSVLLYKRVGGTETTLATVDRPQQVGRTYRMGVRCFGPAIDVILDGATVLTHTLDAGDMETFGSLTRHGKRSSGSSAARFDNFRVTAA